MVGPRPPARCFWCETCILCKTFLSGGVPGAAAVPLSRPCRHACSLARDCGLVGESVVAEVGRSVLPDVALF